jgi:hypothetical protein
MDRRLATFLHVGQLVIPPVQILAIPWLTQLLSNVCDEALGNYG